MSETPNTPPTPAPLDLAELRRIAEAATLGPWVAVCELDGPAKTTRIRNPHGGGNTLASTGHHFGRPGGRVEQQEADAAHIAAFNPQTALRLLAEVTRLTAEVQREREAREKAERESSVARQITFCQNCGANWCDDGNNNPECPYCLLTRERELASVKIGGRGNMLRYIAFVTTGDESADPQLGVDRLCARAEQAESALTTAQQDAARLRQIQVNVTAVVDAWEREATALRLNGSPNASLELMAYVQCLRAALTAPADPTGGQ